MARLELLSLEERVALTANPLGTVTGVVFVPGTSPERDLQGVHVTLTGVASDGVKVNMAATTDATGHFGFRSVDAGTFQLTANSGNLNTSLSVVVNAGQDTNKDIAFPGLDSTQVGIGLLLGKTIGTNDLPVKPAGPVYDNAPTSITISFTGNLTSGSSTVSNVSSTANLLVGMTVTATSGLPANTTITGINTATNSITLSSAATATQASASLKASLGSANLTVGVGTTSSSIDLAAFFSDLDLSNTDQVQYSFNPIAISGNLTKGSATVSNLPTTGGLFAGMTVTATSGLPVNTTITTVNGTQQVSLTGTTVKGSRTVSALSTTDHLAVGMLVTGTGIAANTTITAIDTTKKTITLSSAATAAGTTVALTASPTLTLSKKATQTVTGAALSATLGSMTVNLFAKTQPQTVANFLDYINSGRYDSSIFHRLDTSTSTNTSPVNVLQGGNFLTPVTITATGNINGSNTISNLSSTTGLVTGMVVTGTGIPDDHLQVTGNILNETITATGTTTQSSNTISGLSSTNGLVVGMQVTGTGIPDPKVFGPTTITSINSAQGTITISQNAASSGSGSLTFTIGVITNLSSISTIIPGMSIAGTGIATSLGSPGTPATVNATNWATTSTTGNTSAGSTTVSNLASVGNLAVGMVVTGAGIPVNTTVTAVNANQSTITLSKAATATLTGTSLGFATPQVSTTGNTTSGSTTISGLASTTNLAVGMLLTGTGLPANTFITSINATQNSITVNKAATATGTGVSLTATATLSLSTNALTTATGQTFNINRRTTITAINTSNNSITLSNNATLTQTGVSLTFVGFPVIASPSISATGNTTNNSSTITNLSSTTGLFAGLPVSGTGIPANTFIGAINGSSLTLVDQSGKPVKATATGTAVALTFSLTDPGVANEYSSSQPNAQYTLGVARTNDPNSGNSQFYFNLKSQVNSGVDGLRNFTVFGAVADAASKTILQELAMATPTNQTATNGAMGQFPLSNYTGSNFPFDATSNNYPTIKDIRVLKQNESLTYTATSSNPDVATFAAIPGHPEVFAVTGGTKGGTTTITVTAKDQFGLTVTTTFKVSVPVAISSVTNPVNQTNASSTTIKGTALANASISVTASDGTTTTSPAVTTTAGSDGTWTATVNVSNLKDGTITYTATGTLGSSTSTASQTTTKDTVGPAVTITTPGNGTTIDTGKPTFIGTAGTAAGDLNPITVKIFQGSTTTGTPVDTLTTTANGGAYSVQETVMTLANGTYTAQVSQSDSDGNTGTSTSTFVIDTVGPLVSLTAPVNGSTINDNRPAFSGAAGTATGDLSTITVNIYSGTSATGTPVQTLTTTASGGHYSVQPATALDQGTFTAQASQSDSAGNTGLSSTSTFTIDTTAPLVSLTAPINGSSTNNNQPTFSGTAGTASGDLSTITVNIYSGNSATGTPVQTLTTSADANGNFSVGAIATLNDGTYTAQASQSDNAGNTGTSTANTFTITTI